MVRAAKVVGVVLAGALSLAAYACGGDEDGGGGGSTGGAGGTGGKEGGTCGPTPLGFQGTCKSGAPEECCGTTLPVMQKRDKNDKLIAPDWSCITGGGGGGTGGIDFKCLNDCFGGDFKTAGLAITTFTCVLNNCGATCGSILGGGEGGLPGFPGLPGSGFAAGFEYKNFEQDPSFHVGFSIEAFSPWRRELDQAACDQGLASCPPR